MKKLTVLIAHPDKDICSQLYSQLPCNALAVTLFPPVNTLDQIAKQFQIDPPDILLSELHFSDGSLFDLLSRTSLMVNRIPVMILTESDSFEDAYLALQYHVSAYLLASEPFERITEELSRMVNLTRYVSLSVNKDNATTPQKRFLHKIWAEDLKSFHQPLEQFNRQYETTFSDGIFSALLFKMDSSDQISYLDNPGLRQEIKRICSETLNCYCYDLLYDDISDAVLAFLNYSSSNRPIIAESLPELFRKIQECANQYLDLSITLCVSREYSDYSLLLEAKHDVLDTRWARFAFGKKRIIYYKDLPSTGINRNMSEQLEQLERNIVIACVSLNENEVFRYMDQYFHASDSFLSTREARLFIKKVINNLFDIYRARVENNQDANSLRHRMIYEVNMASSRSHMRSVFYEHVHLVLQKIILAQNNQYSTAIQTALSYIYKNYHKQLSLSEAASICQKAPAYLSTLFKQELGQTFSDYVQSYRIQQAKLLLHDSRKNISEIAAELGFSDVRYFSKYFKRETNLTPSEYRKYFS